MPDPKPPDGGRLPVPASGQQPAQPAPDGGSGRLPSPGGRRRAGHFEHNATQPPDRGRSVADGVAELARRRAAGEPPRRGRRAAAGETYVTPDGTRLTVPPPATPPAAEPTAAAIASLIQPMPAPGITPPPASSELPVHAPPAPLAAPPITPSGTPPGTPPGRAALAAGDPAQGVPVVIDGQVMNIALGELANGYLRGRDYSQKTQAAAAKLRQAQEAQAQFTAARERLEQRLTQMLALDADEFATPIDWVTLAKTDPIGYSQKHARYLARQEMLAEQAKLADLRQREEAGRKQYALSTGHQLLSQIVPGWSDPAVRGPLQARLLGHLKLRGFTDEEIAKREMIDPRDIIILLEAMLWAAHAAQGAPAPQPRQSPTLPGNGVMAGLRDGAAPDVSAADDRFMRSRRLDDAVSLLQARRAARQ